MAATAGSQVTPPRFPSQAGSRQCRSQDRCRSHLLLGGHRLGIPIQELGELGRCRSCNPAGWILASMNTRAARRSAASPRHRGGITQKRRGRSRGGVKQEVANTLLFLLAPRKAAGGGLLTQPSAGRMERQGEGAESSPTKAPGSDFTSADVPGRLGDAVSALPWPRRGALSEAAAVKQTLKPFSLPSRKPSSTRGGSLPCPPPRSQAPRCTPK